MPQVSESSWTGWGRSLSAAALVLLVGPAVLAAQQRPPPADPPGAGGGSSSRGVAGGEDGGTEWFPDSTAFAPLLAAPGEVRLRGSFVVTDRDAPPGGDFEGASVEAEVVVGHRMGVLRFQREEEGRPEVTLGFEVGVFTRFHMETPEKDLVNADFRVGAPLSLRKGPWEGRLTLLHVSSHLGDDFVNRFDPPPRQVTRDGFELLVARRLLPALRAYAGGEWNFHVNPGVERTAARAGLEWDPAPEGGAPATRSGAGTGGLRAWPFAAAGFRLTSTTERVAGTGAAGLALRVEGVTLRLEARGHFGPSPLGQLRDRDEEFLGLGLRVEP